MSYMRSALYEFDYWPGSISKGKFRNTSKRKDFFEGQSSLLGLGANHSSQLSDFSKEEQKWLLNVGRAVRIAKLARKLLKEATKEFLSYYPEQAKVLWRYKKALETLREQLDYLLVQWKICSMEPLHQDKLLLSIQPLVGFLKQRNYSLDMVIGTILTAWCDCQGPNKTHIACPELEEGQAPCPECVRDYLAYQGRERERRYQKVRERGKDTKFYF